MLIAFAAVNIKTIWKRPHEISDERLKNCPKDLKAEKHFADLRPGALKKLQTHAAARAGSGDSR